MSTVSLCMIVKNEEDVIGRCLDSVKDVVDEIIVVDTGSTDKTREILSKYTDKIYDFEWIKDFGAARNFSFSKATQEYVMWLDADDYVTKTSKEKFIKLKEKGFEGADTIMCVYDYAFDSSGNPTYSFNRERIMKNCDKAIWQGVVHEVITPFGKVIYSDFTVSHGRVHIANPMRNIEIYENILKSGKEFSPRDRYYYARELRDHKRYSDAIENLNIFLDEGNGWVEDNITACRIIGECYSALSNPDSALKSLFNSFAYDTPRPEVCCDIGGHFLNKNKCHQAIYWYETALANSEILNNKTNSGFISTESRGYLPAIQLCVCYDRIKDHKKAFEYNEMAGKYRPDSKSYLKNKDYFAKLFANHDG